jgi:Na+-transporting NADH:ubiquinone oxidoreductase subunit B
MNDKKKTIIKWQLPMKRVLFALVPVMVASVYFYGWRALLLLATANAAAFAAEYGFCRVWKEQVSSAVFVTGTLFALSLPANLPLWMVVVGSVFGIVFGKMVFGGFGKNVFNPALTGRAFLYISFGDYMTNRWLEPVPGWLGGLTTYMSDAVTSATPGMVLKVGEAVPMWKLLLGNTSGSLGGTPAILAVIGGLYLVRTKAANYRIVSSAFAGFMVMQTVLWLTLSGGGVNPISALLSGSVVLGLFFYATDPVSASQTNEGRWIYGAFIGIMTCVISTFSAWPAGTMFAILLANMFAPITDHYVREWRKKKKAA